MTVLALALWSTNCVAERIDFSVGSTEVIYSASQRRAKKLNFWPDGNLGVVANGNGTYSFYAANSSTPMKTNGTLDNPAKSKQKVTINGLPSGMFSYVAGGPVYQDPASGARLMMYHAEQQSGGNYSSQLGLALSTDAKGRVFKNLGTIIEPNARLGPGGSSVDVGGGSFAVFDNYLQVYYRDYLTDGTVSQLAVARAPLADLLSNALSGQSTAFTKYFNGGWSEPGRGGLSSALEVGNPSNFWSAVSFNDYLDQAVMVSSQWQAGGTGPDLYLATSNDGVNWSPRQPLAIDAGEQMYPSIIGTGSDPTHSGKSFYVYYTDSATGSWNRWNDARLVRRQVTFDSVMPPPGPGPEPTPMDWTIVSDYVSDFQSHGPAEGWSYDWTANGRLGNSSTFAPLLWSDVAQSYNTTGVRHDRLERHDAP